MYTVAVHTRFKLMISTNAMAKIKLVSSHTSYSVRITVTELKISPYVCAEITGYVRTKEEGTVRAVRMYSPLSL